MNEAPEIKALGTVEAPTAIMTEDEKITTYVIHVPLRAQLYTTTITISAQAIHPPVFMTVPPRWFRNPGFPQVL